MFSQACVNNSVHGDVSQHTMGRGCTDPSPGDTPQQTPPLSRPLPRWPLKRVVCIPLECILVTACKRSLQRLCFYTCLSFCPQGWWYPSMHCRWYPSMPWSRSQGGYPSIPCRFLGPHPGGKLRGIWPGRGGLQAHTQGGS